MKKELYCIFLPVCFSYFFKASTPWSIVKFGPRWEIRCLGDICVIKEHSCHDTSMIFLEKKNSANFMFWPFQRNDIYYQLLQNNFFRMGILTLKLLALSFNQFFIFLFTSIALPHWYPKSFIKLGTRSAFRKSSFLKKTQWLYFKGVT